MPTSWAAHRIAAVVAAATLVASAPAARAGDPSQVWKTIETEHFVVSYYEPLGEVARRVAIVAERAHRDLSPAFDHAPSEKTLVVVTDETDGSNGFASVLPRNSVRIFATAPEGASSLADHDDWLYGLTAHEYAHILHLDTISGLPRVVNRVVGKTWAPNQIQPRWVIEGIATYEESKRSSSGRTRQSLFEADLRVHALAGETLELDALTNGPRAWPQGSAAYQYGSHFLKFVFDRYGDDKLRDMSHAYGGTPVPWGLNKAIERATGRRFVDLYDDWKHYLREKSRIQLETIERRGIREGRRLTFSGQSSGSPAYTADGKLLLWQESDGIERRKLRAMPVGGHVGQSHVYAVISRLGDYDLRPDGSLVMQLGARYRSVYDFQDLYTWDPDTRRTRRLTWGMRISGPSASPDGSKVAFAVNGESRRRLVMMPLSPRAKPTVIWEGPHRFDQATRAAWSPDGRTIAFSVWRQGGYRDILFYDVASGQVRDLMYDRAQDIFPTWSPDGDYLFYSSDRTGVYNVYAYEMATAKTYQVTNVVGCAIEPAISPDGTRMAYVGFDVGGYDLFEIPLVKERWLEPQAYVNNRPNPVVVRDDEFEVSEPRPYRPVETLAPKRYQLQLVAGSLGQALSVTTDGSDIAGHHGYSLAATVGLDDPRLGFVGSYSYRRLWPTLRAVLARNVSRRGGFVIDAQNTAYTEENWSVSAGASLPVLRTRDGEGTLFVDYDGDRFRNVEDEYEGPDPNDAVPRFPETDITLSGVSVRFGYSNTRGSLHTVGPQEGISFGGSLRINHPVLGSDFHTATLRYNAEGYRRLGFLGVTPVVSARLVGGIQASDRARTGAFALGGVPEQDVVQSVVDSLRAGRTGYLRGFPERVAIGTQFHLLNLEYRQELWNIERGLGTLPFYVKKLHMAALLDVGDAFSHPIDLREFNVSAGGVLRLNMVFGYFVPGALDVGYARGLTSGGINEFWMLLTGNL